MGGRARSRPRGTTILLTTQYLDEAEQLADRIVIMHEGRIIAEGTLDDLKRRFPPARVEYIEKQPLTGRSLRHILRSPDTIVTTAVMPIGFLLLFVFVFGGAIQTGGESYVSYLLPGIRLITVASGVAYTAYRLFPRPAGRDLRALPVDADRALVGAAGAGAWLAVGGILLLSTLALTWLAVIARLTAKTVDGASAFLYPLIFLPFLSSAFVPTETMAGPVRWFAEYQPVTSIVNAMRALLAGEAPGVDLWIALAWCAGILVAAYLGAAVAYRRRFR